ncbi:MAG TPA: hypothetical protein VHL58_17060 [Thermoanaerobaculia bacterium]|nr:hypothetical protein [Thermoanaerobaculia bacterium]
MRRVKWILAVVLCLFIVPGVLLARGSKSSKSERLVDSDDYRDKDFVKSGVISDYSDMTKGDGVEWMWVDSSVRLSDYKIVLDGNIKNVSEVNSRSLTKDLTSDFERSYSDRTSGKGTLKAQTAIYWAEKANEGKSWIPYAGGHLAQAGVGVEIAFVDGKGRTVAKLRHSAREGSSLDDASQEAVDDVLKFIDTH